MAAAAAEAKSSGGSGSGGSGSGGGKGSPASITESNVWSELAAGNDRVSELFTRLTDLAKKDPARFDAWLKGCESTHAEKWSTSLHTADVGELLGSVRAIFQETIRPCLQAMGSFAGTEIEPTPSTRLLDHTISEPGVVCAAVPGGTFHRVFTATAIEPNRCADRI